MPKFSGTPIEESVQPKFKGTPVSESSKDAKIERPPEEPGLEPIGLFESFISPASAYAASVPVIGAVAKYGKPFYKEIATKLMPQTGKQLLGGGVAAGTTGVAGELASRAVPEKYKEYKPLAKTGTELLTGYGLSSISNVGRGATPAIPKERIEAAKFLREKGGAPAPEQISLGPESKAGIGRLTKQQGVANQEYNRATGLVKEGDKVPTSFGKTEFAAAKQKANADYDSLLRGRKVSFDEQFFNNIQETLARQQSLRDSGITFGQSRSLIGALEKVGSVPQNLKTRIDTLPRIGEEEATAEQSQQALSILNDMIPALRAKGRIDMNATDYNEIRSILGEAASRTANNRTAGLLRKVQNYFDQAADKSMPDIVRDLEGVRRRYEALKTLEEAQLMFSTEMGVIPAKAVGQAIRKRIEQGSIYGTNNPLRRIGEAGESLAMTAPATGKPFLEGRGLSPQSSLYGAARDLAAIPLYPFRAYSAGRRLEEVPALEARALPTISSLGIERQENK